MQLACSDINATRCRCGSSSFSEAYRRMCFWSGLVYCYFAFPHFYYYYLHFWAFYYCLIFFHLTISPTKILSRNSECFCCNLFIGVVHGLFSFSFQVNTIPLYLVTFPPSCHSLFLDWKQLTIHSVDLTPRHIFLRNLLW